MLNLYELFNTLYAIKQERQLNPAYKNWEYIIMEEEQQTRAVNDADRRAMEERFRRYWIDEPTTPQPLPQMVVPENVRWTVQHDPNVFREAVDMTAVGGLVPRRGPRRKAEGPTKTEPSVESMHFL